MLLLGLENILLNSEEGLHLLSYIIGEFCYSAGTAGTGRAANNTGRPSLAGWTSENDQKICKYITPDTSSLIGFLVGSLDATISLGTVAVELDFKKPGTKFW